MNKILISARSLQNRIENLQSILQRIQKANALNEKINELNKIGDIKDFFSQHSLLQHWIQQCTPEEELAVKSILAIEQGPQVFSNLNSNSLKDFPGLLKTLMEMERVYETIGGIIGYQLTILKLILAQQIQQPSIPQNTRYLHPPCIDISQNSPETKRAVRWGVEAMSHLAVIYPVGGAGDRLNLQDERTGEALPAAELSFCGRTLLEGLIRDLQGREYLHYKLYGKQLTTPIVMMTSHEKNNHQHIDKICKEHQWFGRPSDSFRLMIQPLVPMVTIHGDWAMQGPLHLLVKPGGHGVIWKLAEDQGVIDWLLEQGYDQALVRQINNPIAGVNGGLCAFVGWGSHYKKAFGFASCPRLVNAAEGMDVLVETKTSHGVAYHISNIEYTEFELRGVPDVPENSGSSYSQFPANTNILFADLRVIQKALKACSIPGMLINMKNQVPYTDAQGHTTHAPAGRLESMMQNIADHIVDDFSKPLATLSPTTLSSFITYNDRRKTIAVTKRTYVPGEPLQETPEGCYYELLQNHVELLKNYCKMQLPAMSDETHYLEKGPSFILLYHPALGPLFEVIAQKINGGSIAPGGELQLEIAELDMRDLNLKGSLLIHADAVVGSRDAQGLIRYGEGAGKCVLHKVSVENRGIDWTAANQFWKNQVSRHEALQIILHGNAEFFAEGVCFSGDQRIEVPDGHRMIAEERQGQLHCRLEKIHAPTWHWTYSFDEQDNILLQKK